VTMPRLALLAAGPMLSEGYPQAKGQKPENRRNE